MPLGIGTALHAVVLPVAKTNLCQNPSGELGTVFWANSTGGAIGTSSAFQQYGAWSFIATPTAGLTDGIRGGSVPLINGDYTASAYVRGAVGVTYNLEIAAWPTGNATGSVTFVGGGTWGYVTLPYTEAGGGGGTIIRAVVVRKRSDASVAPFYVDGVQVEAGSATTYIDGDQPGGTWLGAPHVSASYRTGQYRGGGSVVALADLGLAVDQMLGVGAPPIEVSAQSYAITDGAQFQRQRAGQRSFTLTGKPISGTTLADFHVTRRTLWDVFRPDLVSPQQPVRLLYVGAQGTQQLDAYYDKGLELGQMDGPIAEDVAIGFIAADPYWSVPTQQGTTLPSFVSLGSVNFLAYRDPIGRWGTLGSNGTTVWAPTSGNAAIYAVENIGGTVIFGGFFGSVAGTGVGGIGQFMNGAFGSLAGGGINPAQQINALTVSPSSTLYAGGNFIAAGGTATNYVAAWTGAWGTLIGGTMTFTSGHRVQALDINQGGTLMIGGSFNGAAGSTSRMLVEWFGNAYGTLLGQQAGTLDDQVRALTIGLNNTLYYGGDFGSSGGTATTRIGQWNGAFGSMLTGMNAIVQGMTTTLNGQIVPTGNFSVAGSGSALKVAQWNGVQFQPFGGGITSGFPVAAFVQQDNTILISGNIFKVGSVPVPAGAVYWTGASFVPFDLALPTPPGGGAGIWDFTQTPDGTLWAGGDFAGAGATSASVSAIINAGRAATYPVLRMRNTSNSGTARVYQVKNATTGAGVYFNLSLLPGEQAVLTTQPGNRGFVSSFRGNILNLIIPGSNLAAFNLLSGTNYVSFFADSSSLEASFYWTPRGWSIDGGTIF